MAVTFFNQIPVMHQEDLLNEFEVTNAAFSFLCNKIGAINTICGYNIEVENIKRIEVPITRKNKWGQIEDLGYKIRFKVKIKSPKYDKDILNKIQILKISSEGEEWETAFDPENLMSYAHPINLNTWLKYVLWVYKLEGRFLLKENEYSDSTVDISLLTMFDPTATKNLYNKLENDPTLRSESKILFNNLCKWKNSVNFETVVSRHIDDKHQKYLKKLNEISHQPVIPITEKDYVNGIFKLYLKHDAESKMISPVDITKYIGKIHHHVRFHGIMKQIVTPDITEFVDLDDKIIHCIGISHNEQLDFNSRYLINGVVSSHKIKNSKPITCVINVKLKEIEKK